jgi:hypothetical protein
MVGSRVMQDAYREVSGRTTQETKSSNYRGAVVGNDVIRYIPVAHFGNRSCVALPPTSM